MIKPVRVGPSLLRSPPIGSGVTGRNHMRKAALALIGATALGLASAANATITLDTCSMTCTGPTSLDSVTTTIGYSEAGLTTPTFTESLSFTDTLAAIDSVTLDTSSASVDFTSA